MNIHLIILGMNVKSGKEAANYRHGGYGENRPEYNSYRAMKNRCYAKSYRRYDIYGGRGIKVCERWLGKEGFIMFLKDMGKKPTPKHSIDRIDPNGNYTPDNCRWSDQYRQMSHTSSNIFITIGKETKTASQWARERGISLQTVYTRVKQLNWTWERALSVPTKGVGANHLSYSTPR